MTITAPQPGHETTKQPSTVERWRRLLDSPWAQQNVVDLTEIEVLACELRELVTLAERAIELETEREADARAVQRVNEARPGWEEGRALNNLASRFHGRIVELAARDAQSGAAA